MNTEKKQQSYEISEAKRSPQGFPLEKYINASFPKTSISERNQIFLLVKTELLGKVSNKNIIQSILGFLISCFSARVFLIFCIWKVNIWGKEIRECHSWDLR